jgi:hypothetical protein
VGTVSLVDWECTLLDAFEVVVVALPLRVNGILTEVVDLELD